MTLAVMPAVLSTRIAGGAEGRLPVMPPSPAALVKTSQNIAVFCVSLRPPVGGDSGHLVGRHHRLKHAESACGIKGTPPKDDDQKGLVCRRSPQRFRLR